MARGEFTLLGGSKSAQILIFRVEYLRASTTRGSTHPTTRGGTPHHEWRQPPPQEAAPLTIGRSAQCHPLVVGGAALRGGVCAAPRSQKKVLEMHLAPFLDHFSVLEKTILSGTFPLMEAFY